MMFNAPGATPRMFPLASTVASAEFELVHVIGTSVTTWLFASVTVAKSGSTESRYPQVFGSPTAPGEFLPGQYRREMDQPIV